MKTAFLLMAQYDGLAVIPIDAVCRDYFAPLTLPKLLLKIGRGEIDLPLVRIESSRKGAKGIHLLDLAAYIDRRREMALEEMEQLKARRVV